MRRLYSGLEAWRHTVETSPRRDIVASYLPLILSAAGGLGVLPFMVLRYLQGEWIAAVVDTVIVVGFLCLGVYVFRTRRIRFASIAISLFCVAGVFSTMYLIGPHQAYWIYPVLMAIFYLLRPVEALALAVVTIAGLVPQLVGHVDAHSATTILITIVVMSSFAFGFSLITNRQRDQLMNLATKDPLTGAGNRRHFDQKLLELINEKRRSSTAASLLLLDLDNFKDVNDIYGHAAGDKILKQITEIINLRIRVTDTLYRIGGEEFVVVLEGQALDRASHLAEQLRTLVEANELLPDQAVTISLGVAELRPDESPVDWLHRADEALYAAKNAGRNLSRIAA
tara:strand:+ start:3131 stop:4150 length:1020 start_codon:yes stop_codon:yes gene_type:complete